MIFTPEQIKLITSYGVFAILFCSLLVWVLRENNKRELRYQETIDKFGDILHNQLKQLENTVEDIKEMVKK
ncbi:MAG: BhlA/UviB family holin-like peptide [Vallitalea sp.]|jgi:hypothetical protein|nr:BhlA/UviB family holin-like peptide [Vallitalea sp.]